MFKSFFASSGAGRDFAAVTAWAERRGHRCKRERDGNGFVIDGQLEGKPWRLEWGPSQRPYIVGQELRIRMELGLPLDLQLLVMSKPLMESLEKQAFEQYTRGNQTEISDATPEEVRWLVMFPKFDFNGSKTLRASFGGVSGLPTEGPAWIEGALERTLERASANLLHDQPPLVLMALRGRTYLRMAMADPDEIEIGSALDLFETAGTEAIRVGAARGEEPVTWAPTTTGSGWGTLNPIRRR